MKSAKGVSVCFYYTLVVSTIKLNLKYLIICFIAESKLGNYPHFVQIKRRDIQ